MVTNVANMQDYETVYDICSYYQIEYMLYAYVYTSNYFNKCLCLEHRKV